MRLNSLALPASAGVSIAKPDDSRGALRDIRELIARQPDAAMVEAR